MIQVCRSFGAVMLAFRMRCFTFWCDVHCSGCWKKCAGSLFVFWLRWTLFDEEHSCGDEGLVEGMMVVKRRNFLGSQHISGNGTFSGARLRSRRQYPFCLFCQFACCFLLGCSDGCWFISHGCLGTWKLETSASAPFPACKSCKPRKWMRCFTCFFLSTFLYAFLVGGVEGEVRVTWCSLVVRFYF